MPIVTLSSAIDVGNDAISGVSNVEGAPNGTLATCTPTSDGAAIEGEMNLAAIPSLAGTRLCVLHKRTGGAATMVLTTISLSSLASLSGTVFTWTINAAVGTTLADTIIDIGVTAPDSGSFTLAAARSMRYARVEWLDSGDSGGTLSVDAVSVSHYSAALSTDRLDVSRLSYDRLSLSRL